jgi:hypothetical protein
MRKCGATPNPPFNGVASVKIFLRELPELEKLVDWGTDFFM